MKSTVTIQSIEWEFDGIRKTPKVCFEVSQTNGEIIFLTESVKLEPPKAVFESYDEIVKLAWLQLKSRLEDTIRAVDAQLLRLVSE